MLEVAYTHLFLVSPDGVCPPYASHYLNPLAPAGVLAEIEGEYRRAGLALAPGLGEPPDHAAVELEFLSFLCGREARAWRARCLREGAETLQGEARFLATYVCPWFPVFARRVAAWQGDGFYAVAAEAIGAFLQHDRDLLAALLDRYRGELDDAG